MYEPESPCIRHCCLNQEDTCIGCFRTLQEIKAWSAATPEEKQLILERAHNRKLNAVRTPNTK
jgi:predicted Fe-S protein YdhL (DUF1289 family)